MKIDRLIREAARGALGVDDLHRYMQRRGWQRLDTSRPEIVNYLSPAQDEGSRIKLLVPATQHLDDFVEMATRTVIGLAAFEQRSTTDVVAQMLTTCDILKTRIAAAVTDAGSIPLPESIRVSESIRDLIVYAASAELRTAANYRRKLKEAMAYVRTCKAGQTEVGSYVASYYLPLPAPPLPRLVLFPDLDGLEIPFERRTSERIFTGLEMVERAQARRDSHIISENYASGFNANMCEALSVLLSQVPEGRFEFRGDFEAAWPAAVPSKSVELSMNARAVLDKAAGELRDAPVERDVEIVGWIYQLRHELRGKGHPHEVRLMWEDKGNIYKIKTQLDPADYQAACDAHKDEIKVRITGRLERHGRTWYLNAPRNFAVLDDAAD